MLCTKCLLEKEVATASFPLLDKAIESHRAFGQEVLQQAGVPARYMLCM